MEELNNSGYSLEEISPLEADELLEEIAKHEAAIKEAETERDEFIARYEKKISAAEHICEITTKESREKIALITEKLRRFAEINVTDKKRSVSLPTGTLAFRKQAPKFFFDDLKEVQGKDERLIAFVKHNAYDEFLTVKVEESVNWLKFKSKLVIDGDAVIYAETGEIIDGLHAQFQPDKFTVKLS